MFAASALLVASSIKFPRLHPGEGLALGAAAGSLFGVSDISRKFLTHAANGGLTHALLSPWALGAGCLHRRVLLARSQPSDRAGAGGDRVHLGGRESDRDQRRHLVFHDSIGAGAPQIVERMLAFCLVIAGAALMPAPTRARQTRAEPAATRPGPARSAA